jgi:hypothetical protein
MERVYSLICSQTGAYLIRALHKRKMKTLLQFSVPETKKAQKYLCLEMEVVLFSITTSHYLEKMDLDSHWEEYLKNRVFSLDKTLMHMLKA